MSAIASLTRLPALLRVTLMLIIVACAQAQVVEFGECGQYQSAVTFTEEYITAMTEEEGGYVMTLTSGRAYSCQSLTLYKNNTFKYTTHDAFNILQNHTGTYTADVSTFTTPGNINLRLPVGVLGADILGNLRFNVLMAEPDFLLVVSCTPLLGVARAEQVVAFVPQSKFTLDTAQSLNATLSDLQVPSAAHVRVVPQDCATIQRLRGTPSILQIYNLLVKLGLPPIFGDDSVAAAAAVPPLLYSALSRPNPYAIPPVFSNLLQSIANSQPSEYNKIVQSSFYAKPSAYNSVGPSAGYVPQSPQVNYVPSISYAQPPHYLNSVQPAVFASPSGLVNSAPSIAYAQPISQANIVPVAYAQPFGYPNSVSPAFVQPALAQHSGNVLNVPSATLAQHSGNVLNVPSVAFAQQSGNVPSVASYVQQSDGYVNVPSVAYAQSPVNFNRLPSSDYSPRSQ